MVRYLLITVHGDAEVLHRDAHKWACDFWRAICRYVQLPINAGMTEAWEQRWQTVKFEDTVRQLTFMQAAARLGVGVFASAALKEGALLLDSVLEVITPACW